MPLASATRVGPYEIVSTLGSGAMGEVYLARDSRLSRNVALKIIAPGSSDDAHRRRRFEAEARAASSLNHPNIITVHDFGSIDGISYIVSELVEGESIRNLIRRGPMPIRQLLEIATQMADGLAAAHEAGIVHRDLKPENVMVTRSGRVKILDFGLAKPMASTVEPDDLDRPTFDGSPTEPGLILGTVGYMSPEQARGEAVGVASDQFSFGAILHEMATGIPAFKRETPMQTLLAIANVDRKPFTPGPVAFRLLVERCLAKEPAQRFPTTAELRDRLQKILESLPKPVSEADTPADESESSSGSIVALPRPARHGSRPAATLVLGALAAFSLGLLAARVAARSQAEAARYHFTPLISSSSIDVFPALSPSGRTIAYSEPVNGVFQILTEQSGAPSRMQRTRSDRDCFYPFWSPDGIRIYYVSGGDLWSVSESGGAPEVALRGVTNADASPSDGTLALVRPDGYSAGESVWVRPPGAQPKRIERVPELTGAMVKFAPNGNEIGVSGRTLDGLPGFWIVNVKRGDARQVPAAAMRGFSFFPDGRQILFGGEHLWRSNVSGGDTSEITTGSGYENWPSVARGGHEAVFSTAGMHYDIAVFPVGTGQGTVNVPPPALYSNSAPVWSPKRAEFAYVSERGGEPEIRLRDAASGWEKRIAQAADFHDRTLEFSGLAFSPDGQRLTYTRTSGKGHTIWISSLGGEQPMRLADGSYPVWSPDGNWLAYTGLEKGRSSIRKVHLGSSEASVLVKAWTGRTVAWSPNGAWILTMDPAGALVLISPDGSRTQPVGSNWLAATWSRDGAHIVGLRRTTARTLEIASITPSGVADGPAHDLGPYPPALAFAEAIGEPPVRGFSLAPDDSTVLLSLLRVRSDIWKATGF